MVINLKEGKLTIYNLIVSKRITPVLKKISFEGIKEHKTRAGIYFPEEGRTLDDKILRNLYYKKTGRIIEYNDFYSENKDEYQFDYDLYTLPDIYLIIEGLINNEYKLLNDLSKYNTGNISNITELQIFKKYQKQIYSYIYLNKLFETESTSSLELLNLFKKSSEFGNDIVINQMNLEGIKIKDKTIKKEN